MLNLALNNWAAAIYAHVTIRNILFKFNLIYIWKI